MDYSKLLKDIRWQKKRLETLKDAGWKCELLGETGDGVSLNVHHRRYVDGAMPWQYERADLLVLCDECHADWHEWKRNRSTPWWISSWREKMYDSLMDYKIPYTDGSWEWQDGLDEGDRRVCFRLERKFDRFKKFASGEVNLS
jgi:hypothetical protein